MRYLVAFVIGIGALFGVNSFTGIFSMPRPWGSLSMGATVGITMVVVLLIWEVVKPSHKDAARAKPAMSEEERATARAERRSRLAAEAGVSLDDNESDDRATAPKTEDTGAEAKTAAQTTVPEANSADETPVAAAPPVRSAGEDDTSAEAGESSIEAEPDDGDDSRDQLNENDVAQDEAETLDEPETLAPEEYDEQATGSSLESPPTGEPGVSVDSLEDAESAGTDGASDDDPAGDESTAEEPNSKR
ncbi:hypothetical protein AAFP32_15290 [Brevibacterium sp. CBA3109]|uniref:Uncharacterized protein n=1 Tax=Brevibacterium koreense TaxID=3140787 RepID=A0AAU7UM83_9MICO